MEGYRMWGMKSCAVPQNWTLDGEFVPIPRPVFSLHLKKLGMEKFPAVRGAGASINVLLSFFKVSASSMIRNVHTQTPNKHKNCDCVENMTDMHLIALGGFIA